MREEIRGTWLARDCERAEENRRYVRANAEKIPTDIREAVIAAIEFAEHTEQWDDVLVDGWTKDTQRHISEVNFLKGEIKTLVEAIRAATSKKPLVAVADAMMARMRDRAHEEEQKRLAAELSARDVACNETANQ